MSFNQQGGQSRSIAGGIAQLTVTDSTVTHNNPEGLLATQDNGGIAWLFITRTVSRDNFALDLDVPANTAAWLDANTMAEMEVRAGALVVTSDKNSKSVPTVLGTVSHQPAF